MEHLYDEIDFVGFNRYCEKTNFKTKEWYVSNLKNGVRVLNSLGENIENFYDSLEKDRNYLKDSFDNEESYGGFRSAVRKYMKFKNKVDMKYWLISNDPNSKEYKFNAIDEFSKYGYVYWGKGLKGFEVGDIAYIYIVKPIQAIKIKAEITDIGVNIEGKEKFRMDLISIFGGEKLGLKGLERHGLNTPQGKQEIKDNLLYYIQQNEDKISEDKELKMTNKDVNQPLNQILYGPPGTGKTYNTIKKAVEIIENREVKQDEDRQEVKKKFDKYAENGQIKFVTFHQSYGYEEFVEGLKASTDDSGNIIKYNIEDGIFKDICGSAKEIKTENKINYTLKDDQNIWKMSIGDTTKSEDNDLFDYSVKNNVILLGHGFYKDFSGCNNRESIANKMDVDLKSDSVRAIDVFKNQMKKGDIVLVSYGNQKLRAIAKIVGEYKLLDDENLDFYVQSRKVEWLLVANEPFSYDKILKKGISQRSIYDIKNNVKMDELRKILSSIVDEKPKNYVLIIDEINRGNISKIFGELITLIEPSKRLGEIDEIRVELPYSKEKFGVPRNLYIIGTMNTADRSIALMDTALRRRFEFVEMMPDYDTLKSVDGINLSEMLKAMNKRIEYLYDRDHMIGHAYFIDIGSFEELQNVFKNRIIPLLAEYFYDDWEKTRLVLADNTKDINTQFIKKEEKKPKDIFGKDEEYLYEKTFYEIKEKAFKNKQSYIEIYEKFNQNEDEVSKNAD